MTKAESLLMDFLESLPEEDDFVKSDILIAADNDKQIFQWMLSVLKLKNNLDRINMVDDKITQINNKLAVLRSYDNTDKKRYEFELLSNVMKKFRRYIMSLMPAEEQMYQHYDLKDIQLLF